MPDDGSSPRTRRVAGKKARVGTAVASDGALSHAPAVGSTDLGKALGPCP